MRFGLKDPSASKTAKSFVTLIFTPWLDGTVCRPWSLLRKALIRVAKPSHHLKRYAPFCLNLLFWYLQNNE
jgi:hypothetical protein